MEYSYLNEEKKITRCVTPILVSATKSPDEETSEQVIANHERFRKLPFESKYKLGFQHTPAIIQKIGEDFNLDPLKMASIARAVRSFYFGDLPREKIAEFLVGEMEISLEQAQKITSLVVQKIIEAPIPKEVSDQTVDLPLLDAMAKYQRLSEQGITEDRITVKGEPQPVRGSLRNWVRHYRDALGIRKHSAMERGQFLFQGENTKRLGAADREKLSLLFRSLDENMPVSIDVERQEVMFPAFEEKATPSPVSGVSEQQKESTTPALGTSFRPLEKFPAQTAPIHKALEWDRKSPPHASSQPDTQKNPAVSSVETPSLELTKKPGLSVGISAPAYDFGALQKMSPSEPSSEPRVASPAMPPLPKSPVESPSPPFASGGKMSFSSSHILPSEKQSLKEKGDSRMLKPETSARDLAPKTVEAVGIIRPRGEGFGFRPLPSGSRSSDDKNSFDAPRVVNFGGGK